MDSSRIIYTNSEETISITQNDRLSCLEKYKKYKYVYIGICSSLIFLGLFIASVIFLVTGEQISWYDEECLVENRYNPDCNKQCNYDKTICQYYNKTVTVGFCENLFASCFVEGNGIFNIGVGLVGPSFFFFLLSLLITCCNYEHIQKLQQ